MITQWLKTKPENASAIAFAVRRKHERQEREESDALVDEAIRRATKALRKEASMPAAPPWLESKFEELLLLINDDESHISSRVLENVPVAGCNRNLRVPGEVHFPASSGSFALF